MPTQSKGHNGHSYRFDLSNSDHTAADVMFSVFVPGPIHEGKAVEQASKIIAEMEEGIDLPCLEGGRIYFHPRQVTRHMIKDISPARDEVWANLTEK